MSNFTNWKYYTDKYSNNENVGIVSPDGKESRSLQDSEVIKFLEEGNTPLPADS